MGYLSVQKGLWIGLKGFQGKLVGWLARFQEADHRRVTNQRVMVYNTHISVEWYNKSNMIKYLFKYVTKEIDRATPTKAIRAAEQHETPQSVKNSACDERNTLVSIGYALGYSSTKTQKSTTKKRSRPSPDNKVAKKLFPGEEARDDDGDSDGDADAIDQIRYHLSCLVAGDTCHSIRFMVLGYSVISTIQMPNKHI
ncbi:unnamed protein product [Urochloa humidicola]